MVIAQPKFNRYGGYEVKIFDTIATKLNFKYTISPPKSAEGNHLCRCWGGSDGLGNYTGLIGDLYNDWCDVAWANLYDVEVFRETADLTPYSFDRVCFLVSKTFTMQFPPLTKSTLINRHKNHNPYQSLWLLLSHLVLKSGSP